MKKTIMMIGIVFMLVFSVMVLAEGGKPEVEEKENETHTPEVAEAAEQHSQSEKIEIETKVTGLENAMLRVRKNESVSHLEDVLNKIAEHKRLNLYKLDQKVVEEQDNGEVTIHGKGPVKLFSAINWQYEYEYKVNPVTGDLTRNKRWYDIFMAGVEDIGATA
jgi:hypothetical protein